MKSNGSWPCPLLRFGRVATASRTSRVAAWLFVPYTLWVGFASALNFAI